MKFRLVTGGFTGLALLAEGGMKWGTGGDPTGVKANLSFGPLG